MRILLIEDDLAQLEALGHALTLSFPTFTFESADSAEAAEELIARGYVPELVITDVRLPGKSGVELLLELQTTLADVRFILTSGYAPPQLPGGGDERVLSFLQKPFELSELVSEVQDAFLRGQSSANHGITPIDILQVLNMARRTALVELRRAGEPLGEVYLVDGEVHHASCGDVEGAEAFRALCADTETSFRVRTGVRPPRRTVDTALGLLLLDVMGEEET